MLNFSGAISGHIREYILKCFKSRIELTAGILYMICFFDTKIIVKFYHFSLYQLILFLIKHKALKDSTENYLFPEYEARKYEVSLFVNTRIFCNLCLINILFYSGANPSTESNIYFKYKISKVTSWRQKCDITVLECRLLAFNSTGKPLTIT